MSREQSRYLTKSIALAVRVTLLAKMSAAKATLSNAVLHNQVQSACMSWTGTRPCQQDWHAWWGTGGRTSNAPRAFALVVRVAPAVALPAPARALVKKRTQGNRPAERPAFVSKPDFLAFDSAHNFVGFDCALYVLVGHGELFGGDAASATAYFCLLGSPPLLLENLAASLSMNIRSQVMRNRT